MANELPTPSAEKLTLSQRFADAVTNGMGSWTFIIGQSVVLAAWIALNKTNVVPVPHWDPNLILLNLALSCEAAFAGAFILMSQKRGAEKDRQMAHNDYLIDCESERSIKELHSKVDTLLAFVPPEKMKAFLQQDTSAMPALKPSTNDNGDAVKPAGMAPK